MEQEQNTLKITSVLSDPTRFSIYQYVSTQRSKVTVQEIADQFSIHPNVARLHLTKLEDVKMIISETLKSGKGGRPSRFYSLSDEVIQLQFPFRDYQRLAKMAIETLNELGDVGVSALKKMGYKYGRESAELFVDQFKIDLSILPLEEKIKLIEQIASNEGLNPEILYNKEKEQIEFSVFNCTFKELMTEHSNSLCVMHHELFKGIFSLFLGDHILKDNAKITDPKSKACSYAVIKVNL
ncbi:helix-turn-helix transcriptional regulator [Halalkalibacter akibai]|uniref:Transcriptional regulator n=1 Tax=Halalkalibacter akibai (strain ATCC 43226 / DSM 21942 / CIP 109018 / JCM 9157 / 1139) TaxID=1236973 RepID=W4QW16_HALA3|nr:helix-turn-helix domain-containing protein [Halalkalibacter akibai]GAE36301.1 transcriptional regulator [Halalkalibacter akibai JCM 9157]